MHQLCTVCDDGPASAASARMEPMESRGMALGAMLSAPRPVRGGNVAAASFSMWAVSATGGGPPMIPPPVVQRIGMLGWAFSKDCLLNGIPASPPLWCRARQKKAKVCNHKTNTGRHQQAADVDAPRREKNQIE